MRQLVIEPEFRDKIPPLSDDEFSKLEENILSDGEVREPLVVWHNTIIDGHHRWKIIQQHPEIPYKLKQMDFPDKWSAIVWMCRNQLGRRNITDEQRTVLIGEAYKAQKMKRGAQPGNTNAKKQSRQNDDFVLSQGEKTKNVIARNFGVGSKTVERAEHYVDGLNAAEEILPGIKEAVLTGDVKAPKQMIAEIRKAPEEKREQAVKAILYGDTDTARAILRPIPKEEPAEEPPEFSANDLAELIDAAARNLDFALNQHLVLVHGDILQTEEARTVAENSVKKIIDIANKYIGVIRRIEDGRYQHERHSCR